eukprot:TRINITY_DN70402_c0_g1_i1.p1 TRINITY_DN70402_c0_g1~~TRINITY_DN70402_c0_g1_i1.p1  ORF type:complete len:394 (-),score=41.01 TRINITY_DN70402_c0_g1_i1:87-1268(-)
MKMVWVLFFLVCFFSSSRVLCMEDLLPHDYTYNIKFTNLGHGCAGEGDRSGGDNGGGNNGGGGNTGGGGGGVPIDPTLSDYSTIDAIWANGYLICGTENGLATSGIELFDAELCRAVAAAFWDDSNTSPDRVRFVTANHQNRFTLGSTDGVQLISQSVTKTALRAVTHDVTFGPVMLWDSIAFLVDSVLNLQNFRALERTARNSQNLRLCVVSPSTTLDKIPAKLGIAATNVVVAASEREAFQRWQNGDCSVLAGDRTSLRRFENEFGGANPTRGGNLITVSPTADLDLLTPIAPVIPHRDPKFALAVELIMNGLVLAAEQNPPITREDASTQTIAEIYPPGVGAALKLGPNFMKSVIATVGNYNEIFSRAFPGEVRGPNALAEQGGVFLGFP